ncbi:MAG: TRAP transporter fused permease subunit [Clostridia bacterium]|jgi:TRAP transporter 4TM/12TM fusion protein|nr:TRAP transporter fused permease subunit [Clostridia bacterium]
MFKINNLNAYLEKLAAVLATLTGIFHILNVSGVLALSAMTLRVIHLMAMMSIMFLLFPKKKAASVYDLIIKITGTLISLATGFYILYRWQGIIESGGVTNSTDIVVGIIFVVVLLLATKLSVGNVLMIIALLFLLYPFLGQYLPGMLQSKAYSMNRVISFIYVSTQGIYGIPISVSASYIVLFCIYGAFLNVFGAGEFMFKLAASLTRGLVAATAKTAVIFSLLAGMISGSAAGNVAISGSITIPMMKKNGYKPEVAGAIEAVASTGGQVMPPVMGAAAFIMAEMLGMPYISIMKAAIIPALLYFISIYFIVHLTAIKGKIDFHEKSEAVENLTDVIRAGWYYILPILALFAMLALGYSPFKAAYYSIICMLIVYLIATRDFSYGFIEKTLDAFRKGTIDSVTIAIACAASGIIVGVISMTGLGTKLSNLIILLSQGQLLIALFLTMLTSIILGMGLPTTAVYLVVVTVVAPALVNMGVPLLTAHMFVFFFGCISTITPPVALASYVAAGLAGADVSKVGWTAFRFGLVSFILPYMFVYSPSLLASGSWPVIARTMALSILGVYAIAASIVGYFKTDISIPLRILLFTGGLLLVDQGLITDISGLVAIIGTFIYLHRKAAAGKTVLLGK